MKWEERTDDFTLKISTMGSIHISFLPSTLPSFSPFSKGYYSHNEDNISSGCIHLNAFTSRLIAGQESIPTGLNPGH